MVPLPRLPVVLMPQHMTVPPFINAQVKSCPAVIPTTPLESPLTGTGVSDFVVVPLPSWPFAFEPQHKTPPAPFKAQVCCSPAVILLPLRPAGASTAMVTLLLGTPDKLSCTVIALPPDASAGICAFT